MAASSETNQGDHFFQADGIDFHYRVHGQGPYVVFGSVGWGMPCSYLWRAMDPQLESKYTAIYFEPRGNGQSSKPADDLTMTSKVMAEDFEHLRKHLGWEKFPVLAGHSNGACIALRYAETYPSRVDKLILIDAEIHDCPNNSFQEWIAKRKEHPVYGPALGALLSAFQSPPQTDEEFAVVLDMVLPYYFADTEKTNILKELITSDSVRPSVWAFLRQGKFDQETGNRLPHVTDAHHVTAKTLILWGEEDALCSLVAARALAEALPNARLEVLSNTGHFPWIEQPQEFYEKFNHFLQV